MKKNLFIYFPAIFVVLAVKLFYRTADSDMLLWILMPTAGWVRILSGIPFEYISRTGYVSHEYRFIIASSCSGVRFLLLVFVMLVFSFTARIDSAKGKVCWFGFSAFFSYLSTVFVNGVRIAVSIYLPLALADQASVPDGLTAERLHTVIGTTVYFSMLFVIYYLAGMANKHLFARRAAEQESASGQLVPGFLRPVFWYFVMVLGLPFAGRLYRNDWEGFLPYALLVTGVCVLIVCIMALLRHICFIRYNMKI